MARRPGSTRGSEAIEIALALPVFLMFTLGIADCGRLLWTYTTIAHAAAVAARCGAINTTPGLCDTTSHIATYAATQAFGLGLASSAFTPTSQSCGTQVSGTMTYQFFIPWFYGASPFGTSNQLVLTAVACYPL
jgi:Flp pilus assembly protein TadG